MSAHGRTPADAAEQIKRLVQNISGVFIGKDEAVTSAVLALVSGGHLLIEDVPGVGKTLLARTIAKSIAADFKRIQFTADLLPSDITGVTVFMQERQEFVFRRGPIFTNILLGDEINRATPRTQSSLLEAMEEQNVTVEGSIFPLESPFFVIATQNPVELEGTYPLPFAQMDRFMIRLNIGYLARDAEVRMLQVQQQRDPLESLGPVMDCKTLTQIQAAVRSVTIDTALQEYLVNIVHATRTTDTFEYGASPRGSLDLQVFSQAAALWRGRDYVLPDDIKESARFVLPHRLITRKGTRNVSAGARVAIDHILDAVPVPV